MPKHTPRVMFSYRLVLVWELGGWTDASNNNNNLDQALYSIVFNADFGVHNYVSVGPWATFRFNQTVIGIGGRGNFHFWQLASDKASANLRGDVFDLYLSLYLGADIYTDSNSNSGNPFRGTLALGFRWMPTQNIGLFTEFASPSAWWTIGAAIRL